MDALVEEFMHLNINSESRKLAREQHNAVVPYSMQKREQNLLVIYKKDGAVVSYKGLFDPTKKRRNDMQWTSVLAVSWQKEK
jgi:hypothetical protein